MSWQIGSITLPMNPRTISFKQMVEVKSFRQMDKLPLLLSFGPKTDVLTLEGIIWESGKTAEQLSTDYILPLQNMASRAFGFSDVICDEDMVADSFWSTSTWDSGGIGTPQLTDVTDYVTKGNNACKIVIPAGSDDYAAIYHNYTPAKDFSEKDFVSWWWYGANSGYSHQLQIKVDDANYYYLAWLDNFTGWKRLVYRLDEFTEDGSGDWSTVNAYQFVFNNQGTWYVDRNVAGLGQLVDGPGTRYDNIFFVNSFTHEALKGNIDQFTYKLELWNEDDYF